MRKIYFLAIALSGMALTSAQSWVLQSTNLPQYAGIKEISIVNESTVWASSYDGSGGGAYPKDLIVTTDGGNTWTVRTVSAPSGALISDVHGVDGNTAYVVTAPTGSGATNNGIWKTTDGGATWTKYSASSVFSNSASFANHVYFWDANNGFTGGDPVGGKFEMYKTTDGGATWTAVTTAPAPENGNEFTYVGQKYVVGDNMWFGTSTGRILHTTDRGATWSVYSSPALDFGGAITNGSSADFTFADANNGLLVTDDNGTVFLYKTTDGGATWEDLVPIGSWYPGDIAHVKGTQKTYVSAGINAQAPMGSSYSKDGGETWIDIDMGEQRGRLEFLNGTTGWCGQFSEGPGLGGGILKFNGDLSDMAVSDVQAKSTLKAYPVPAQDEITFTAKKEIKMISIIDMTGKVVSRTNGSKVSVSSLNSGVYVAQARYADGSVENIKVAVK